MEYQTFLFTYQTQSHYAAIVVYLRYAWNGDVLINHLGMLARVDQISFHVLFGPDKKIC